MLLFCNFSILINPIETSGQTTLSWDVLADITFEEKYDETNQTLWLIPKFGKQLQTYQNQTVILEGFFIPINMEDSFVVLSRFPNSSCFFVAERALNLL